MRGSRPGRRVVLPLVAAGATGVLILLPLALGRDDPDRSAGPAGVSEPSEPSGMVVLDHQQADVDGDGRSDEVRLLRDSRANEPAEGLVKVILADGQTAVAGVPLGYFGDLRPQLDINGDGRQQVLLNHTGGGDASQLLVYGWHDGGLVALGRDPEAPLGTESYGSWPSVDYYVDESGLHSWARLAFDPDSGPSFGVEMWSWSVEDDHLVATPSGHACVDVTTHEPPRPCE